MHAVLARLMVRGTRGAHAVKLDAAADAAVLDLAAAADSRLPLARHGDFVNVIYNGFDVTRWRLFVTVVCVPASTTNKQQQIYHN